MFSHIVEKFKNELFNNGQHLTIAREYDEMRTNMGRLLYGEHLFKKYNQILKWESGMKVHNKKSDETSISLRVQGNNLHNKGEYVRAVIYYNKSLCFAASSENIAIGYSNRSASLFEMGRFKDCKENIRLARELNVLPENIKKKLDSRFLKCGNEDQEYLHNNKRSKEQFNLTYRNHASLPFIVDRLEIKQESGKSWIYAKEHIEPGTVIMKEEILNFLLLHAGDFMHCHFCLKVSGNLIPCPDCTSAMFCNKDCMNRANEEFHKWECPIKDLLNSFGDRCQFSFRIFLNMLHVFGDYDKLEKYWKERPQNSVSWFSIKRAKLTRIEQFQIFHSSEKFELQDSLDKAVLSASVAFFKIEIMKYSDLKRIFQTKQQSDLFAEIFLHNILLLENRSNLVLKFGEESLDFNVLFLSAYPLIKEIKPTDSPNVSQKWYRNHIVWSACRQIKKGEFLQTDIRPDDVVNILEMKMVLDQYIKMNCNFGCNDP